MKLLCFQARRFGWTPHRKNLADATEVEHGDHHEECVVAFLDIEAKDQAKAERSRTFRHTLKHLKWLANKRDFKNIVLHSFTHLGGDHADPEFALGFLDELAGRLTDTGYAVKRTPFGYFCAWNLDVYGESLAKVWKEI